MIGEVLGVVGAPFYCFPSSSNTFTLVDGMHLRAYPPRSHSNPLVRLKFKKNSGISKVYKMQIGKGVRAMKAMLGVLGKRLTTSSMIHDAQRNENTRSAGIKNPAITQPEFHRDFLES